MLVIGAGLLVRTVYNLTNVDAGFDRSRLVTFSMTLPQASYPAGLRARAAVSGIAREASRACPACRGPPPCPGLPPDRPLNANDTDIDNYTAPPEGPFENVDYYQNVMSDYFETMGIPIVQGRGFRASRRGIDGHGRGRQRDARQHVLEGTEPDRPAAAAGSAAIRSRGSPSSASPRTSSRAASIRKPERSSTSSSTRSPRCRRRSHARP